MFPPKTEIFHGEFNFLGLIANKVIQSLGPSKPNCPVKKWLGSIVYLLYFCYHQENNMLLGSLEVLESAGLTGLTRASFNFFK